MTDEDRDNSTFTAGQIFGSPKNIAVTLFFFIFLVLFKLCLTSMIKINLATVCNPEFHDRAIELLHQTLALLNMKDAR